MDNGDQIQQTNLVSDGAVAALDGSATVSQPPASPAVNSPQIDPIPTGSAADPTAPAITPPTVDTTPTAPATTPAPTIDSPAPSVTEPTVGSIPSTGGSVSGKIDHDELEDIKRSALEELKPLIEHVEQSPEERFETVMMMIRSNDDPKLIPTAYEAAKGIENEKTRASALLNIVSEIEYLKSKAS